jgi:hypothetical protein
VVFAVFGGSCEIVVVPGVAPSLRSHSGTTPNYYFFTIRSFEFTHRSQKQKTRQKAGFSVFGGSCEIRTHGGLAPSPVFKTGAFNRSAKLPSQQL